MTNNSIIQIDIPQQLMTPAMVKALILTYRGLGVHADHLELHEKQLRDDVKTFLIWLTANDIKDDDATIKLDRLSATAPGHSDAIRITSAHGGELFFKIGTRNEGGSTYECIESITAWLPGKEAVRPKELVMIAPSSYLNESQFAAFMQYSGCSETDVQGVVEMVKKIIDDYPISHGADRPRLYASRLFNIVRINTPMQNDFEDESGALFAEVMVADKGSWSRAARLHIATGWEDLEGVNWSEKIVRVERPKGDEPEKRAIYAMGATAGVYQYLNVGEGSSEKIHAVEPELREALKLHLTADAGKDLTDLYQQLTSPSNPDALPGTIGYRLHRFQRPNLAGMSNPVGTVLLELFMGERMVGAITLNTAFMPPLTELTLMDGLVRVDYVEMIAGVQLDAATAARIRQPRHGWTPQGNGWGGYGGQRWGGGPTSDMGAPFAQHHAWGPAMQTPFAEEAKLSTFSLDNYSRILKALIENIPTLQHVVTDVIARMYVVHEQLNPQVHGQLIYQFEFNMAHGLLMRAMSQSGVVHLQQVAPMQSVTASDAAAGKHCWQ